MNQKKYLIGNFGVSSKKSNNRNEMLSYTHFFKMKGWYNRIIRLYYPELLVFNEKLGA